MTVLNNAHNASVVAPRSPSNPVANITCENWDDLQTAQKKAAQRDAMQTGASVLLGPLEPSGDNKLAAGLRSDDRKTPQQKCDPTVYLPPEVWSQIFEQGPFNLLDLAKFRRVNKQMRTWVTSLALVKSYSPAYVDRSALKGADSLLKPVLNSLPEQPIGVLNRSLGLEARQHWQLFQQRLDAAAADEKMAGHHVTLRALWEGRLKSIDLPNHSPLWRSFDILRAAVHQDGTAICKASGGLKNDAGLMRIAYEQLNHTAAVRLSENDCKSAISASYTAFILNGQSRAGRETYATDVVRCAKQLMAHGDYEKAANLCKHAITYHVHNADTYFILAQFWQIHNDFVRAEKYYKAALKYDPISATAQVGLGNMLWAQNKWDEAVVAYTVAKVRHPSCFAAHFQLGKLLHLQMNYGQAEISFRRATQLDATYAKAFFYLAETVNFQHRSADAQAEYENAIRIDRCFAPSYRGLACALDAQAKYDLAQRAVEQAFALERQMAI